MSDGNQELYNQWHDMVSKQAEKLNGVPESVSRVFEVGPSGKLYVGDVHLSKGDDSVWDAEIVGVKPGIWAFDVLEDVIAMRWFSSGPLDLRNLPEPPAADEAPECEEELGSYSVDSGLAGVFDSDGLEAHILSTGDRAAVLESLGELSEEVDSPARAIPGGVILAGNDGGSSIKGQKDEDGKVIVIAVGLLE